MTEAASLRRSAAVSTAPAPSKGAGACSHPVTLRRTVLDTCTGEVRATDHTKRCGSRIAERCPSCSALYRGDAFSVIRSGLIDPSTKLPKLVTMVTLTAPGSKVFGQIHSRRVSKGGKVQRCSCRAYHNEGDPLLGTPVDPSTYDYEGAAAFNANASRLFAVTMQKLGRILGRKLQVVRVVEFQTRGLVHIHALVLGPVTQRSLELVVRGGMNLRTGRRIAAAQSSGWEWGPECKADVISTATPGKAIGYLVKVVSYALKDTGSGAAGHFGHGEKMSDAATNGLTCGNSIYECVHGTRRAVVETETVDATTGATTRSTVEFDYQGRGTRLPCRRHRRAEAGWGFRGHVLAKSRSWGCTFREVRARREAWAAASKPALPPHLVVTWERLREAPAALVTSGVSPP